MAQQEYRAVEETQVEETILVPPGSYTGTRISVLGLRDTEMKDGDTATYLDLDFEVEWENDDGNTEKANLRAGYPYRVTEGTMLGKLLKRFGVPVKKLAGTDDKVNPADILDGRSADIVVIKDDEGFSSIVRDSVEPSE